MEIAFLNGNFLPKEEITISPDDRGFMFAEGIYEVVRWYEGYFFDMESHLARLKRNLREVLINWPDEDTFPSIALKLIDLNNLKWSNALVYLQVTRGVARRTHSFPSPEINPTVYAFATDFVPENEGKESGVGIMLKNDIRWNRCDIKSTALLPNTISFNEAREKGFFEVAFVRNGIITECSHSNIFFIINGVLYTHPESNYVLPGITRKNILKLARHAKIPVKEVAVGQESLNQVKESFISNTSGEITPVVLIGDHIVGNGTPGPITRMLRERFNDHICSLKH